MPTSSEKQDVFCTRKREKYGNVFPLFSGGFLCSCVLCRSFHCRPLIPSVPSTSCHSLIRHSVPFNPLILSLPSQPGGRRTFLSDRYSFLLPKMFWSAPQNHLSSFFGETYTFGLLVKERGCNDYSAPQLSSAHF